MRQDHYVRLMERMNQNEIKHPQTNAMLNVLKELFTEEQAALIGDFPLGAYTAKALTEKIGRNEADLAKMLGKMSADGLIFEATAENGQAEYSVLAFEPGLMELQYLRGLDDERTRKFVRMIKLVQEEETAVLEEVLKDPGTAREMFSYPVGRIVAIEENISNDKEVANWEKISGIIENETSFAVGECGCKHIAKLNGNPCTSGAPSKCCVWFGKVADYLVERDYATRYTKEDLYQLLKSCEEAGLVHFTTNRLMSENIVLCNCCKCCCGYLKNNKRVREAGLQFTATTNFVASVNKETCTACGECVDHCQLEALALADDMVDVNEAYCMGCGACVSICPTESMSLVRVAHQKPLEPEIKIVGSGV
jgi:Pyruvate/2-oxoacid:ferredoxin oxidoreductase delta subunit